MARQAESEIMSSMAERLAVLRAKRITETGFDTETGITHLHSDWLLENPEIAAFKPSNCSSR